MQLHDIIIFFQQQLPFSSRPPIVYYTVRHNVATDADGGISQMTTNMTNITIDGAQPGHVYYIEVTAVNILGPGQPKATCESIIIALLIDNSFYSKKCLILHCSCPYRSTHCDNCYHIRPRYNDVFYLTKAQNMTASLWFLHVLCSDSGLLAAVVVSWVLLLSLCTANAVYIAHRYYTLKRGTYNAISMTV